VLVELGLVEPQLAALSRRWVTLPDKADPMSSPPPMATPRVAAGVLFRDQDGRVLLVKPTDKDGWDLPGGYVEPGERPKQAARREVREELGIGAQIGQLLVVDWAPHPNERRRQTAVHLRRPPTRRRPATPRRLRR
jgi:ADP-ribose pyrophosphatase YjhB (NUDIX family)